MATECTPGECSDDRTYTTPVVVPKLPSSDGGGHEIVTSLPDTDDAEEGVVYIVMDDVTDCDTFTGAYVYNADGDCFVNITSGEAGATYTFEDLTDEDDNVIGWVAKKNGTAIYTYTDISGGSPTYYSAETFSTTIGDTTTIDGATSVYDTSDETTQIDISALVAGSTLLYDEDGSMALVESVNTSTDEVVARTVTIAGSGSGVLENSITVNNPIGRYADGDVIAAGTSYETIFRAMLTALYTPTYTAPSATLTASYSTYYKVGSTASATTNTLAFNAGAITLNGTKQADRAGAVNTMAIATSGADTEYSSSVSTTSTSTAFSVSSLTRSTKGTIVITGTVSYDEGPQPYDSDGNAYGSPLAAGSVTAKKTLTFIQPFYYGVSDSTTVSDFSNLTESVTAKGAKTFSFTTSNQHMVFAYDSSYGDLSSILDSNGFEVISGWSKSTLTVDGFSYYVWVADSATTDTSAAFTFKF